MRSIFFRTLTHNLRQTNNPLSGLVRHVSEVRLQVQTSPQKGVKHLAQSNQQPSNEIADAVRNAGAILIYFLTFLVTVAMAIVVLIDRELWFAMLAFAVL